MDESSKRRQEGKILELTSEEHNDLLSYPQKSLSLELMKKITSVLIFHFLLFGSLQSFADTCPRIKDLDPFIPPTGWSFLISPDPSLPFEDYRFSGAIHSLNGYFYYLQVICRYDACPSFLCPAFTLISNKPYQEPSEPFPPWNHRSVLKYTLTCMPGDHDPAHCVFQ